MEKIESEFIKSIRKYLLIYLLMMMLIQLIIQFLYNIGETYPLISSKYLASDVLTYWGSAIGIIVGAFVTIIGIRITIDNNMKATNENIRNSILPLIIINRKLSLYKGDFMLAVKYDNRRKNDEGIDLDNPKPLEFIEKDVDSYFISIHSNKLEIKHEMSEEEYKYLNDVNVLEPYKFKYFPFTIINAGLGTAVNMTVVLQNKNANGIIMSEKSTALSFSKDSSMNFVLLIYDMNSIKTYKVVFDYYDLNGNHYNQEHTLEINAGKIDLGLEINQDII